MRFGVTCPRLDHVSGTQALSSIPDFNTGPWMGPRAHWLAGTVQLDPRSGLTSGWRSPGKR
jgi:hypothetical protein